MRLFILSVSSINTEIGFWFTVVDLTVMRVSI